METVQAIFAYLIFPGFLFSALIGLGAAWFDRKITARLQYRVGPPLAQPLYDVVKLMGKEPLIPAKGNRAVFVAAPVLGLVAATTVSVLLWQSNIRGGGFVGDLIVAVYFLIIPPLAVMLGGFASGNPLAAAGASREMKLILSYELPFLVCLSGVIIKHGFTLNLARMAGSSLMGSVSGLMLFFISLICIQAKLGYTPFDVAEAETEIIAGPYIEYSAVLLATFKLTQAVLHVTLPLYLITVFWGGIQFSGRGILWALLKFLLILLLFTLIKNVNPRIRIDQSLKFFWWIITPVAVLAVVLAVLGSVYGLSWL